MKLKTCLKQLKKHLRHLNIYYKPHKIVKRQNEIFFGRDMLAYYTDQRMELHQGNQYYSTTEMILKREDPIFSTEIPMDDYNFYFEDLSADACLSFIFTYCQYYGVSPEEFPTEWIDYTIRWEIGDVKTTGKPFESWGCLHSALAHAYFIVEEQIDSNGEVVPVIDETNVHQGLMACFRLIIELLLEGVPPYEIPYLDHIEEYNRATMHLNMEYQKYLLGLKKATITQLELPVMRSERKILVDAFITTENTYMGLLKSFLIHDEERTWLKSGFQFFAIHRPELKGTGRDMVIQVDPQTRAHLKDLWERLEQLEKEERNVELDESVQFWNHKNESFAQLVAPKSVDSHYGGSRLDWSTVVSIIWELYNPAKSITVNPFLADGTVDQPCRIYECPPILWGEKTFKAAKWNSLGQQQVLVTSPTLQRYLAVCAANEDRNTIPPIHPLPQKDSFDFIEIPCGYALIHDKGIFILDDWISEELDFPRYTTEVKHLMERLKVFKQIHKECIEMMSNIQTWLNNAETLSGKYLLEANQWITLKKAEIRHTLLKTMLSSSDYYLLTFRQTVEKRWAIQSQLDELYNTITELEQILENHMSLRTNRLIDLITIFGFPLALFSGLFEIIFEGIPSPQWLGINWTGLFLFFILSFISTWGLNRYIRSTSDQTSDDKEEK